jgi:hypothetical protein
MKRNNIAVICGLFAIALTQNVYASANNNIDKNNLTPREIMKYVEDFDDGDDFTSRIELLLIDRYGNKRQFKMRQMRKYFGKSGRDRYTRSVFYYPEPLENISVLSFDYDSADKTDDRWIYIPGIKDIKKINSEEAGKLMGSDISYSDLNRRKVEEYQYKKLGEEEINGWDTWKIEYSTNNEKIIKKYGYKKGIVWVDKNSFRVIRAIFWVADKQFVKKYYNLNIMKKIDGIWTPVDFTFMTKRKNEVLHVTKMKLNDVKYYNILPKELFETKNLNTQLPQSVSKLFD